MKIIAIIVAVLLVFGLILGYGFNNALKAKTYGKEVSNIIIGTLGTFTELKASATLQSNKDAFTKISFKAKDGKAKIEAMVTPKGTETLRSDAIELLDLVSDISNKGKTVYEYIIVLQESNKMIKTKFSKATDLNSLKNQLVSLKTKIDGQLTSLSSSVPPPSLARFHLEFVDAYSKTSKKLGEIIVSIDKKDFSKAKTQLSELSTIADSFSKISIPNEKQLTEAIFPAADQAKLQQLAGRIDEENDKLQKQFFVF